MRPATHLYVGHATYRDHHTRPKSAPSPRIASAHPLELAGRKLATLAPRRSLCCVVQEEYRDVFRQHGLREQITLRNVASELASLRFDVCRLKDWRPSSNLALHQVSKRRLASSCL